MGSETNIGVLARSASFLNGVYHNLQLLSFSLLGQHMDDGVRRSVVDVTCAFVQRECSFKGISEEDIDGTTLIIGHHS